jgi:phenylalanyl-tRNA synthetase beta chain
MRASAAWLRELSGIDASAYEIAERLTRAGIEVEAIHEHGVGLDRIVSAEVRSSRPHPTRDRLKVVRVWNGREELDVVCGAPNVPGAGARVLLAEVGARLPNGTEIAAREIGGVVSQGMLCSEAELGIGEGEEGIAVFDRTAGGPPGTPIVAGLGLRDEVLELSLTPNRADCLGHIGLAREIALLFGMPFVWPPPPRPLRVLSGETVAPGPGLFPTIDPLRPHAGDTPNLAQPLAGAPLHVPISVAAPDRCARYLGLVFHHTLIRQAPFWMRYRLHILGQRAINSVVDVTNWVLLETGHPIHAFDLERLRGPAIVVRTARPGETMTTLDGVPRTLSTDDLVIADADAPVALAGVMGGAESGVHGGTRAVLLEVAYFDPRSVRRTARRHGLHTEASHRFERGCDPHALEHVMRRAAALLSAIAEAAPSPVATDAHPRRISPVVIHLREGHAAALLGGPVPAADARRILEGVGCTIAPAEQGGWRVTAPTFRPDLGRAEDLIEEIARVRGYDAIPADLAPVRPRAEPPPRRDALVRAMREAAVAAGLYEAIHFAFLSPRDLERARAPREVVAITNPISEERSVMRTSLLPGLLASLARSQRRQARRALLFELGRTYHPSGEGRPVERLMLAILLAGPREGWVGDQAPFDFYDGKGAVEQILRAIGLEAEFARPAQPPAWLHPRRAALLRVAERSVGALGEVHPDVAEAFEVVGRPVYGELDVDALVALAADRGPPQAQPLPRFPAVFRDLAVVVPELTTAAEVAAVVREAASLVEEVAIFDVYRGKPVPEGRKSLAFRIAYRDPEATLTDARVEELHAAVVRAIGERFGGVLRT